MVQRFGDRLRPGTDHGPVSKVSVGCVNGADCHPLRKLQRFALQSARKDGVVDCFEKLRRLDDFGRLWPIWFRRVTGRPTAEKPDRLLTWLGGKLAEQLAGRL